MNDVRSALIVLAGFFPQASQSRLEESALLLRRAVANDPSPARQLALQVGFQPCCGDQQAPVPIWIVAAVRVGAPRRRPVRRRRQTSHTPAGAAHRPAQRDPVQQPPRHRPLGVSDDG